MAFQKIQNKNSKNKKAAGQKKFRGEGTEGSLPQTNVSLRKERKAYIVTKDQ